MDCKIFKNIQNGGHFCNKNHVSDNCTLLSLFTIFLSFGGFPKSRIQLQPNPPPPEYRFYAYMGFFNPFVTTTFKLLISRYEINIYQNITHTSKILPYLARILIEIQIHFSCRYTYTYIFRNINLLPPVHRDTGDFYRITRRHFRCPFKCYIINCMNIQRSDRHSKQRGQCHRSGCCRPPNCRMVGT